MQSINAVILNPVFLAVFFGTAALCAFAMLSLLWTWGDPGALWRMLGGGLYLAGGLLVTMARNVPLNQALAPLAPDGRTAPIAGATTSRGGPPGTTSARWRASRQLPPHRRALLPGPRAGRGVRRGFRPS